MRLNNVCSAILCVLGPLFIAFGIVFAIVWANIFTNIFYKELVLSPNSKTYDLWKTPPIPISLDIYFYNWTNHEEFLDHSTKPNLVQLGPYRFRDKADKIKIQWNPENSTVSYTRLNHYYFDAEGSNGTLNDTIVTLNIVSLAAAARARHWTGFKKAAASTGLSVYSQEIHVEKTVDELLFTGYSSDLIDIAKQAKNLFGDIDIPFDRFGWFYTRNGSDELTGHFNIKTGADGMSSFGELKQWNFKNRTDYFESHCGMVNGSGGEFYPPNQTKDKPVTLFTPELCRSISFDFEQEVEVEGIKGYKYAGGPRTVDNGTKYPENWCFCGGECAPSGVLNISSCRLGTPVFMSFPHYFNADPYYLNMVNGLKPEKDKHEFYIVLEPETGITLEVAARFQINMLIRPDPLISLYSRVPYIFFPVLWFEQKVSIDAELAAELRLALKMPIIGRISSILISLLGLVMLLWVSINFYLRRRRRISDKENRNGIKESEKIDKMPEGSPLIRNTNILKNVELKRLDNK